MGLEILKEDLLDNDGFLREMSSWNREAAVALADLNDLGPLTEDHWRIIRFVQDYYETHGDGPPVVRIGIALDLKPSRICELFPCGIARGAYRLAGLPRPAGCL